MLDIVILGYFATGSYIKEKGIRVDKIKKDTLLFSGSAKQAIKFFPQNINVVATLSIAGKGLENTIVRIVASPNIIDACISKEIKV